MIYLLLGRLGLKVPDDISLVGAGGPWREGAINSRLTSVVVDEVEIGRRAAQLLQEMRNGDRPLDNNEEIIIPLAWAQGQTLAPPPQGSRHTANR
jgi:DNA-binding LacI/PurR family transcriptional regulator